MNQNELFENNNDFNLQYKIYCIVFDLNPLTKFCSLSKIFQGHIRAFRVTRISQQGRERSTLIFIKEKILYRKIKLLTPIKKNLLKSSDKVKL